MNIKKIITATTILTAMACAAVPTVPNTVPLLPKASITASAAESLPSNANYIFNYLKSHTDWNTAAICGVMSHLNSESGLYPTSENPGPDHAYGLAQWLGPRKQNLMKRSNYQNIDVQLQFMLDELKTISYFSVTNNAIRNAPNTSSGARQVARTIRINYGWQEDISTFSRNDGNMEKTLNNAGGLFWNAFSQDGGSIGGGDDSGSGDTSTTVTPNVNGKAQFNTLWVNGDTYIFTKTVTRYTDKSGKKKSGSFAAGQKAKFTLFAKSGQNIIGHTSDGYYVIVSAKGVLNVNAYVTVDCDCLNVRSNPDTSSTIVSAVYQDTSVLITKTCNDWGYAPNLGGWISLNYVRG